jgi:hypothetical protein
LTIVFLLTLFAQMVLSAPRKSPTIDEPNHLTRGYAYLETGDLRLSRDEGHPPLYNLLCALPLALMPDLYLPTHLPSWQIGFRNAFAVDFLFGTRLVGEEQLPLEQVFFLGRLPVMWTTLLLSALVARWAGEEYGRWGSIVALFLCAFDPNLIAHGRLVTTDVGVTFAFLLSVYLFWRYVRQPSAQGLVLSGLALGFAQGTKFSALLLIPMLGLLGLIECLHPRSRLRWTARLSSKRHSPEAVQSGSRRTSTPGGRLSGLLALGASMVAMLLLCGVVLWASYGFQMGPLVIPSGTLRLPERWASKLASVPVPAPIYVEGLLKTLAHASEVGHPTFLMGDRSDRGWWFYFPVAFALKTPLPTLLVLLGAGVSLVWARFRRDEWPLVLVPGIYFALSMGSELNLGYRHLLPILPFLWVFAGRLGALPCVSTGKVFGAESAIGMRLRQGGEDTTRSRAGLRSWLPWGVLVTGVGLAAWLVVGNLWIAPHYLTFFNLLAGGPREGWRYLVDSNLDWGQELWGLDAYLEKARPERLHLSWFGCTYPHLYGRDLDYRLLPSHFSYPYPGNAARSSYNPLYPEPGLYVVGATNLNGVGLAAGDVFKRFRDIEPIDRIGHSLLVYEVPVKPGITSFSPTCISRLRFKDLSDETEMLSLGRGPGSVKWFDERRSFVLPGSGEVAYVLPNPPLAFAQAWQESFLARAKVMHRQPEGERTSSGRKLPPAIVYHLQRDPDAEELGSEILAAAGGASISWSPSTVFDQGAELHPLTGPVSFEHGLDLVGYVLLSEARLKAGETLELLTVWRANAEMPPEASDLRVFVHLLDSQSQVWGAEDRLDLHPPTWGPGDILVQHHRVPLSSETPPGTYQLQVGLYAAITMERLVVHDGDRPVGDRLLLTPIDVGAQ